MVMTKHELVERTHQAALADHLIKGEKPSKILVERIIDIAFSRILDSLEKGEPVLLPRRLGRLTVKERPATKAKHPRTGAVMEVPAKKVVRFSAGQEVKDKINKKAYAQVTGRAIDAPAGAAPTPTDDAASS